MSQAEWLGRKLNQIRRENGWTLKDVAARSKLAVSTLSKVENHKLSLTYDNLIKLAAGLEVDISELFALKDKQAAHARRSIAKLGSGTLLATDAYDYYYLCQDIAHKKMIPIVTLVKARSIEEFGDMLSHSGEEFIFVLSGAIEVHTANYDPVVLSEGEGVYIDSTMPHAYLCASSFAAKVLGICSSPETNLRSEHGAFAAPDALRSRASVQ